MPDTEKFTLTDREKRLYLAGVLGMAGASLVLHPAVFSEFRNQVLQNAPDDPADLFPEADPEELRAVLEAALTELTDGHTNVEAKEVGDDDE